MVISSTALYHDAKKMLREIPAYFLCPGDTFGFSFDPSAGSSGTLTRYLNGKVDFVLDWPMTKQPQWGLVQLWGLDQISVVQPGMIIF